jgi:hypothetical protein
MLSKARVLIIVASLLFSWRAFAQNAQVLEQAQQLLDWLGFRALLEQVPATLDASINAEAHFRKATPQQVANWRRELEPRLKPQQLYQDLAHYLGDRYVADTFQHAAQRLQQPLAKRARYFDLAMTQPGAEKNLRDFFAQNEHAQSGAETRRVLMQEIDAATASSLLIATMQTAIGDRVHQVAGGPAADAATVQAQIAERQRYLASLTVAYLLYDYRYLRDDELSDYRDLMRDEKLQWLLDVGRQGLAATLEGDIKPPPDLRR